MGATGIALVASGGDVDNSTVPRMVGDAEGVAAAAVVNLLNTLGQ